MTEAVADPITELALDLRWAWNHANDELWRQLDAELWEATRNPWLILQAVSRAKVERLLAAPEYREQAAGLLKSERERGASDTWFHKVHPQPPLSSIAYFSMEYMLSEALPIYSGGLGNVAGDQLKAASDLGVPVIAIGLLYQQGYFRQEIDATGAQVARYPFNDPGQLPIRPLRDENGDWLRLRISLPGYILWIRTWEAQVGCRKLYLLDTNDPANLPVHRTITSELYGGGPEMRLRQEAVLGIGGWRLLRALGLSPGVCHLNEGHCAFAVLERARSFMQDHHQPFEVALEVTRAGNLFTTHTPVEAGFDRFSPELMKRYFTWYAEQRLNIPLRDLLALGRRDPADDSEPFNMAYLAIRGSGSVNGVSRLHGAVSRRLFRSMFPRYPEAEVPIGHVTNGVHVPTWNSAEADALWSTACGQDHWRGSLEYAREQIQCVEDAAVWELRTAARRALVAFARKRVALQRAQAGAPQPEIDSAAGFFDDTWLTLGFARRFTAYKRNNLLLRDPERLVRILTNPERPVQLILAGKAHPADSAGQAMIQQWNDFVRRPGLDRHVAYLADHDMMLTGQLVAGVDVWINTPRRPWEASGTSGMKVLANGGLNLSELDGWWAEAYASEVGWALGDGVDRGDDPAWDSVEADQLYALLEQQVIPGFYSRGDHGLPHQWIARIRESMARLTTLYSANRAVRQYTEEHYLPLAARYRERAGEGGRAGAELFAWKRNMQLHWGGVKFGSVSVQNGQHGSYVFTVEVYPGAVGRNDIDVQLYAEGRGGGPPIQAPLEPAPADPGRSDICVFSGEVPGDRSAQEYTARVRPRSALLDVPLELPLVLWQK